MQDYHTLMQIVKSKYSTGSVITFGGSYGGMLAAWMRIKYPEMVNAAVVSGGPLLYFKGGKVKDTKFFQWIGQIYDH